MLPSAELSWLFLKPQHFFFFFCQHTLVHLGTRKSKVHVEGKRTKDPKQKEKMGPCGFSSSSQRWAGAWGILHSPTGKPCSPGHGRCSYLSLLSLLLVPCARGVLVGPSVQGHLKEWEDQVYPWAWLAHKQGQARVRKSKLGRCLGWDPEGATATVGRLWPWAAQCWLPLWTQCCFLGVTGFERERMASLTFGSRITPLPLFTSWPLDGTMCWREKWRRGWMRGTNHLQRALCWLREAVSHTGRTFL